MIITLSFDKFASHFCRTLELRVMNQNSGVGNIRSFSFHSVLPEIWKLEHFGNPKNEKLLKSSFSYREVI